MQLLPGWHPLVVHFPLALISTAVVALTAARLLRAPPAETLAVVGTWNLCLGALGILLALATGLAAAVEVQVAAAAHEAITTHFKSAIVTSVLVLLVAVWRGAGVAAASRPSVGFLLVLWIAAASLIVTGYRGGQNVYRFGVGVNPSLLMPQPMPPQ